MLTKQKSEQLGRVVKHTRPLVLKRYAKDTCILTTAVLGDVCQQLGIPFRPLTVRCAIYNAPFVSKMLELDRSPESKEEAEEWFEECGAWSVGIGVPKGEDPLPGNWGRHLIGIVDERYMLDLTIDQANRPEHGIALEPFAAAVPDSFLKDDVPEHVRTNGCLLFYYPDREDTSFSESKDWYLKNRRRDIVSAVMKKVR